jgi:hypothetical protein
MAQLGGMNLANDAPRPGGIAPHLGGDALCFVDSSHCCSPSTARATGPGTPLEEAEARATRAVSEYELMPSGAIYLSARSLRSSIGRVRILGKTALFNFRSQRSYSSVSSMLMSSAIKNNSSAMLRAARALSGLKASELATLARVDASAISRLESARHKAVRGQAQTVDAVVRALLHRGVQITDTGVQLIKKR